MKEKLIAAASRYTAINLAFLPVLVLLRVIEYFILRGTPEFPKDAFSVEFAGFLYDLFSFAFFMLFLFIPFYLVFIYRRKTAEYVYIALLCLLSLLQIAIIRYFSITLAPLDEVFFSFSLKEIMLIIRTSDELDLLSFLPVIVTLLLIFLLQFLFRKKEAGRTGSLLVAGFIIATLLFSLILPSVGGKDEPEYVHNLKINKSGYFLASAIGSLFRGPSSGNTADMDKKIEAYHSYHPEFNFTGNKYPLFHEVKTPDALGPFFRLSKTPPNLVFIIVESLSSACLGDSSWYGNFTPFLDSLKNKSLFWDNFLSTSERTFHVLQALFGSLPYGKGEFQKDMAIMPNHFSLIRTLGENGYYSGFYYGGDATFTNYDQFLKKQGLNFLLRYFGPKYEKMLLEDKSFKWGYQDEALFQRAIEVIDSLKRQPRMDIYLTLSTHFPFHPPRAEFYLDQVQKILDKPGFSIQRRIRSTRFRELLSSVLYTDNAIRSLIREYAKRPGYSNTIFIITGDHSFTEFGNTTISAIEHYKVPMIIYSPMLKQGHHFQSVSSHLDITPSLLALIAPAYNLKTENDASWLGQGVDTTTGFRNIHTMAFTRKSNKTVDYLKGDYFYSGDLLYRISEGLRTTPVSDDPKREELSKELKTTVAVYEYTNKNNLLIPQKSFKPVQKELVTEQADAINILKTDRPGQEFLNLITPAELKSKYQGLQLDVRFRYMIGKTADTSAFPSLTASIESRDFKLALYHIFKFPDIPAPRVKSGQWYVMHLNENLDVSMVDSLKGEYVKLYFYYHDPSEIKFDSIHVRISGIK